MDKIKCFSLIIALKRKKKNSKILKRAKYKLAADYNLHPTTFCKLLQQCISEGWIEEIGDYYHIKKFSFIVRDLKEKTGNTFRFHQILGPDRQKRHQNFDVKLITKDIETKIVIDNVIAPQEFYVNLRKDFFSRNQRTVKKAERRIKKLMANDVDAFTSVGGFPRRTTMEEYVLNRIKLDVVTSDRNTARKTGFSKFRSRQILNSLPGYTREVKSIFRHSKCIPIDIQHIAEEFPEATIVALPYYSMIKICFGSVFTRDISINNL